MISLRTSWSTPASIIRVLAVCLRSWNLKCRMPDRRRLEAQVVLMILIASPSYVKTGPRCWRIASKHFVEAIRERNFRASPSGF